MKKTYLSLAGSILFGSLIAQSVFFTPFQQKASIDPNSKAPVSNTTSSRAAGPFRLWVDPVGAVMTQKGLYIGDATADQTMYVDVVYQDSTVRIGSGTSTTSFVNEILLGSILDPKSTYLQPDNDPLVTMNDSFSIDSLIILGSYVKKTNDIDTLYTWLVWGDSTNTGVFSKRPTSSIWNAPMSAWRTSVIGASVSGATGAAGNKIAPSAPASNMILVKYVLTNNDSSAGGYLKYINIALPTPATIPAGNIVSCFYTFVPGGPYVNGDCAFNFPPSTVTQNINGFGGAIWAQANPPVTQLSDYQDHQVDPNSWCMGTTYSKDQRHAVYTTPMNNSAFGNLITAPIIYYSIYGISSVGIISTVGVWPGDADSNTVVDNDDLLTIGLYYGQTGSPRVNISNVWQADSATNWGIIENNGVDIKNADCNGDGTIDANDTLAINLNFNLTHAIPVSNSNFTDRIASDLYFVTTGSSFNAGDWVDAELWLGSSSSPINNLYGIAFNINYDASLVQAGSEIITYTSSWLGTPGINAIKITKSDAFANTAYGAVTRIDHTNISGYGKIADFKFQVETSLTSPATIILSISNYKANNAEGEAQTFTTSIDSIVVLGVTEINKKDGITISPNPFTSYATINFNQSQKNCTIKIMDILGKEVKTINFTGKQLLLEKGEMKKGIYFVQVVDSNKNVVNKKIVVQ